MCRRPFKFKGLEFVYAAVWHFGICRKMVVTQVFIGFVVAICYSLCREVVGDYSCAVLAGVLMLALNIQSQIAPFVSDAEAVLGEIILEFASQCTMVVAEVLIGSVVSIGSSSFRDVVGDYSCAVFVGALMLAALQIQRQIAPFDAEANFGAIVPSEISIEVYGAMDVVQVEDSGGFLFYTGDTTVAAEMEVSLSRWNFITVVISQF